ncbi:MAG: peptidoglycan -binding protein [Alphaproteobacteria bacterium]|nr:peptidoglycan -binding protein [Alphaproteobacteria bacterium]
MARSRARSRGAAFDYWPGFVDMLSTLLLVITFLLSLFMLSQHFLSQALSSRDDTINGLNAQIAALARDLDLARTDNKTLNEQIAALSATLEAAAARASAAEAEVARLGGALSQSDEAAASANDQLALVNQQLNALQLQLQALQEALEAAEARDKEQQAVIADLGKRLNAALAQKVQELQRFRSEFFGRLREILGDRQDIQIVGDRFVFQSEVLLDTGSAEISEAGKVELAKLATALIEISAKIPNDIEWILRVDGHSDKRPIATAFFPSNLHLSAARAIAVVTYLIAEGVPAERLAAAGFADLHPLDPADTEEAYRKNRRIEFKLTER